jgi:hypothetical protein
MTEPSALPFESYFSSDAVEALEHDGFRVASGLLSNDDVFGHPTVPYEVPVEALLEGVVSECATLPFVIDELPEEAFRTAEWEEDPFERFNAALGPAPVSDSTPTAPRRSSLPKLARR